MTNAAQWAKRVAEWRASGQTSMEYCSGKDFTAGGLRNAAHLLGKRARDGRKAGVQLARLVRASAVAAEVEPAQQAAMPTSASATSLVIELGGARLLIGSGFERATLSSVLELLSARGGSR